MTQPSFLTAQWRDLVLLNYEIDPELIRSRVPAGTELDFWNGSTYVSLVGFRFLETRLLGWRIPFHVNFDEVNLRFYVRHKSGNEWRRGVVFLKEIVPRFAVALVARRVYNEQYVALPMRSTIKPPAAGQRPGAIEYAWKWSGQWNTLGAQFGGDAAAPEPGSQAEFIIEHYWGYTSQRDGSTMEYQVQHPPWRIWPAVHCRFDGDVTTLYGPEYARLLNSPPASAIVAEGSEIVVRRGQPIQTDRSC